MSLSVLGIGQAGGNLGSLFAERGYNVGIINYSQADLSTCSNIDEHLRLRIIGSEGVGRDRGEAIKLMNNNWESCLSFVKENFSQPSTEMILVVFSCGGGTGSGVAPLLCEILTNELDKTIIAVPILPSKSESIVSHINTLECLEQLSELNICIIPIDNDKVNVDSKNQLYKQVNLSFVELMDSIIKQTDRHSVYGNLDRKDLLNILKTPGFCNIAHTNLTDINKSVSLSSESITRYILESWMESVVCSPSYEKIIRFGLIFNGQENLMPFIKTKEILDVFGNTPLDVYEGWYVQNKGDVYSILTGLSFNKSRLREIENRTQGNESLQNALNSSHSISFKPSTLQIKPVEKHKKAISSILSKYKK